MPSRGDRERCQRYHRDNAETIRAQKAEYYRANREAILARHKRKRETGEYKSQPPEYKSAHHRLKAYGLSEGEFQQMLKDQDNRCVICEREFAGKTKPCVDHCHETGRIRGLLCNTCNTYLGVIKENPDAALRIIHHLRPAN